MCQFNNLTSHIASKNNYCIISLCVGEVLLKQWKQGNTWFTKTKERPLGIGVFFLCLSSDKNMDEYFYWKTNNRPVELHYNVIICLDIFFQKQDIDVKKKSPRRWLYMTFGDIKPPGRQSGQAKMIICDSMWARK